MSQLAYLGRASGYVGNMASSRQQWTYRLCIVRSWQIIRQCTGMPGTYMLYGTQPCLQPHTEPPEWLGTNALCIACGSYTTLLHCCLCCLL